MDRLIEFAVADGNTVLVEVSGSSAGPLTRGGSGMAVFERAQQTFEDALGHVRPAVQAVLEQMVSLGRRPSEVCVEFGVDLHAEAGAFIARTGAAANFTVRLTWHDPDDP